MNTDKIINFSDNIIDNKLIDYLAGRDEVGQIVIGQDYHLKKNKIYDFGDGYIMPTSIAIVSEKHIFPRINSNTGCTMATIVITDFFKQFPNFDKADFIKLTEYIIGGFFYHLQFKLNYFSPLVERNKFDINSEQYFKNILRYGDRAVVDNFSSEIRYSEGLKDGHEKLEMDVEELLKLVKIKLGREFYIMPKKYFGSFFGGNHFFELQVADNNKDDLFITFHTAGDNLLRILDKESDFYKFIVGNGLEPVNIETGQAKMFLEIVKLFINYNRAYIANTMIMIENYFNKIKPGLIIKILAIDRHDGLFKEKVNGKDYYIFRQGSISSVPGQTHILSGYYNANSFLWQAGENIGAAYNTIDHGMATSISSRRREKLSDNKVTLVRLKKLVNWWPLRTISQVELIDLENDFVRHLEKKKLIKIVSRLKPIYNIKTNINGD
ncbi:MAG: RtcB family protein [Patescibacteria group bacterium]|jgi:hypothetical protein